MSAKKMIKDECPVSSKPETWFLKIEGAHVAFLFLLADGGVDEANMDRQLPRKLETFPHNLVHKSGVWAAR
jgi:hypothetical protein